MRRSIGDTLGRLKALAQRQTVGPAAPTRLGELTAFGSNPGKLGAWCFVPKVTAAMPLVVVLHGCTQSAAAYDIGSGWSVLAERYGFALLFAEQRRSNNLNLCFNWYLSDDTGRGRGEALSIRQMIAAMAERHPIDPARVFVTGLSAGGAMTSVMLATYPELFAGGAIIAGLPYGEATSVPEAFDRMRGHGFVDDATAAGLVRHASKHDGAWPTVAVWHGTADATVAPINADAIIGQWRSLHGVGTTPDEEDRVDGFPHRVWRDQRGRAAIEQFVVTGMGHGTPLKTTGDAAVGSAGPHMLDVGISSTWHIAKSWGLIGKRAAVKLDRADRTPPPRRAQPDIGHAAHHRATVRPSSVQATIEAALRSAGLMR